MRLKGPENCGGFTHGGVAYAPDKDGCIVIDDEHVEAVVAAMSHGYAQAAEQPKRGRRKKAEGAENSDDSGDDSGEDGVE